MKTSDNQVFTDILRKSGYRATPGKIAILKTLTKSGVPLTVTDLIKKLPVKIDQVTAYRSLESFTDKKLVVRVNFNDRSVRYESLINSHHHHHIVCTDCGVVEDFEVCDIKSLSKNVLGKSSKFKAINQHSLEFFGVCKTCTKS